MSKRNLLLLLAVVILFLIGTYIQATTYTVNQAVTVSGLFTASGHTVLEGVTSTGATGTGKLVYDGTPTIANAILTAPALGTPASGVMTNVTSIPGAQVTGTVGNGQYQGTLGSLFVATDQSTASTTPVDLTTADTVTFTCAATCNAAVMYTANEYNAATAGGCTNTVFVDGSQADDGNQIVGFPAGTTFFVIEGPAVWRAASLTAASHTIKVEHFAQSGTCHWRDRMITIVQAP